MGENSTVTTINNINSTTTLQKSRPPPNIIPAWYWALLGIIAVVSISGNGLVIYVLSTKSRLRTSANWFVLSLSAADFLIGLFLPPMSFVCVFGVKCDYFTFFIFYNILLSTSVASICVMTFDRFLGIVFPLKYHMWMTARRIAMLIALAWIVPTLLSCLPLTWVFLELPTAEASAAKRIYTGAMLVIFEFLPPVVMLTMYLRILLTARRHARQTANQIAQLNYNMYASSSTRCRTERSVRVVGAVVLLFVACWLLDTYKSICNHFRVCHLSKDAVRVSLVMLYFNSAVNPVVYALLKADVKRELRKLFICRKIDALRSTFEMTEPARYNEERHTV